MTFAQWIRDVRSSKRFTQTECATRAGMKLQQWNQIEKQVKNPERSTVLAVARGLQVHDAEALQAAGYAVETPEIPSEWRATLDKMMRLPAEKRERVRKAVDHMLEAAF